uniref:Si:ch211-241b2.5 n=1 Tax=Astyanax mexicanus TaxID=7994 RepID=A0A3B1K5D0_ASTMX
MKRTIFIFLLAITWPSTQALFTVTSEQDSYDGELHKKITMGCRFSPVEKSQISQLSVIWQRVEPLPVMEVYRLEKGVEIRNVTDGQFQNRAQLLKDELKKFRAVLELFPLQISDSGTYQCIVKHKEADYKKTTLTVRAPYRPVRKNIRRLNNEEVELSCESQGFPLAHVDWSEEELTRRMNNTSEKTSEGTYKLTSRVTVTGNVIKNYTCSFMEEKKTGPSATFNIPGEIPVRSNWSHGYAAVGVISVMCLGFAVTSLILHWRRKGVCLNSLLTKHQTNTSIYLYLHSISQSFIRLNIHPSVYSFCSICFLISHYFTQLSIHLYIYIFIYSFTQTSIHYNALCTICLLFNHSFT